MKGIKSIIACLLAIVLCAAFALGGMHVNVQAEEKASSEEPVTVNSSTEEIVAAMSLDEKISQMIIPAFRTWNDTNMTDLNAVPELAEALRKHQYGGVILYAVNITDTAQVTKLTSDLQKNNAQNEDVSVKIPYFTHLDEEGGNKVRISSATRMNGNMGVGATGKNAQGNAFTVGRVIGEELAATGFNVDYAPDADVNNNPLNPVIGTRSFSDDPQAVATLAVKYREGLAQSNIIGTYKHFPGHGDTYVDSHIGTPTVNKTYEQLKQMELVPFKNAIENGADLIMTAHITYPLVDDEQTFPDGTKGFYPATMSHKMMTDILRGDLGYDGVIVTDALEMGGITTNLVPGEIGTPEFSANIAEKVINAGVDMLLLPRDMNCPENITFYDEYIDLLIRKVENGSISMDRIDESVTRIINLKKKYKVTETDTSGDDIDQRIAEAEQIVGSREHHDAEMKIAQEVTTLVKNDGLTLPLTGFKKKIVFVGRDACDNMTIKYAVSKLQEQGLISEDARIVNLVTGTAEGPDDSDTKITIDYYFEGSAPVHYTDELKSAVKEADAVIVFGKTSGIDDMVESAPQHQGITAIMTDAHNAGAKYIYLSDNLPYDAARYQGADAIMLTYMGEGLDIDPAQPSASGNMPAYNANVVSAIFSMFDKTMPEGTLPVNVPVMEDTPAGPVYTDETLYARGFGLGYTYEFFEGAGSSYEKGKGTGLTFKNNARADLLTSLMVDGKEVDTSYAAGPGYTTVPLPVGFLDSLENGEHKLTAVYAYGDKTVNVETTFTVTGGTEPTESTDPTQSTVTTESTGTTTEATSQQTTSDSTTGGNPTGPGRSDASQTGDINNMLIWSVLAAAAAGVIVTTVVVRKRS